MPKTIVAALFVISLLQVSGVCVAGSMDSAVKGFEVENDLTVESISGTGEHMSSGSILISRSDKRDKSSTRAQSALLLAQTPGSGSDNAPTPGSFNELNEKVERLKSTILQLDKEIERLERELLVPPETALIVYLDYKGGRYFRLESASVMIDGRTDATHNYNDYEIGALLRGGVQQLYKGNVTSGEHDVVIFLQGQSGSGQVFKRAVEKKIEKGLKAAILEVTIKDHELSKGPKITAEEIQ